MEREELRRGAGTRSPWSMVVADTMTDSGDPRDSQGGLALSASVGGRENHR